MNVQSLASQTLSTSRATKKVGCARPSLSANETDATPQSTAISVVLELGRPFVDDSLIKLSLAISHAMVAAAGDVAIARGVGSRLGFSRPCAAALTLLELCPATGNVIAGIFG
jgi:hypothetical protein